MIKDIKTSSIPWTTKTEYDNFGGYDEYDTSEERYSILETRTRESIMGVMTNLHYVNNGTVALDFENEQVALKIECGGTDQPACPTTEYLNDNGLLISNPNWTIDDTLQEDTSLYLNEYQQMELKKAQISYIEAQLTGWLPHYENRRNINVQNGGGISNSQGTFVYADEFDQLPKQTKIHLRKLMLTKTLQENGFNIKIAESDYVKYSNLFDKYVQLTDTTFTIGGTEFTFETQKEFNEAIIDLVNSIIVGAIQTDIVSISDEVEEMILPVEEASQATHNKQVVQKFLETDETINQNKIDTDERLELIEADNIVQGSQIQTNTTNISANTSSISGLAQIIANSGKRFDGRLGAININNQELPLTITQVKNNYDYLTFTSPNTFVWNDTIDGNDLPNQSLVVGANFDASGAGSSVSFRVKNSLGVVVYSSTETITDGGALTLLDSVNLINGETYTCFVFSSNQVRMTGGTIELLGDQVGGGGASTSSQVVDDSATEPTLGINPKLIKIGENTTAIEATTAIAEGNTSAIELLETELAKKEDKAEWEELNYIILNDINLRMENLKSAYSELKIVYDNKSSDINAVVDYEEDITTPIIIPLDDIVYSKVANVSTQKITVSHSTFGDVAGFPTLSTTCWINHQINNKTWYENGVEKTGTGWFITLWRQVLDTSGPFASNVEVKNIKVLGKKR